MPAASASIHRLRTQGYNAGPSIAYDQTRNTAPLRNGVVNGKFGPAGRLYMVYTDEPVDQSNNNTIVERYSDDNGADLERRGAGR